MKCSVFSILSISLIAVVDTSVSTAIFSRSWANINWVGEMGQESRSDKHIYGAGQKVRHLSIFLEHLPFLYLLSSCRHD